jgi:hypothetical protein
MRAHSVTCEPLERLLRRVLLQKDVRIRAFVASNGAGATICRDGGGVPEMGCEILHNAMARLVRQ